MKNLKPLLGVVSLALAFTTGCSIFGHKEESKGTNEVIDAGLASKDQVKIKTSAVLDEGIYREKEDYADVVAHGGKNGRVIPTERFYAIDREQHVPVGKMLYVLTDDAPAHCILGKYGVMDGRKKLIVFSKSVVPTNYCIYQKQFSSEPEGFSIYIRDGGRCKPSFTTITTDHQKRKMASVEEIDNTVSMSYCLDGTMSYGLEVARRTEQK